MTDQVPLDQMLKQSDLTQFSLQPYSYMVSYNGVLCLVFKQWSTTAMSIKIQLNQYAADNQLKQENNGSKFPKVTLACLHNGTTFTVQQLSRLRDICVHHNKQLEAKNIRILFDHICIVTMLNRSISGYVYKSNIPLRPAADSAANDLEPNDSRTYVQSVVAEFHKGEMNTYIDKCNNTAVGRVDHYFSTHVETTCVAPINETNAAVWIQSLYAFTQDVNTQLPNMYQFFGIGTLHVTLRAIN